MDTLLSDIPKAVSRLDDFLVAGTDEENHLHTLLLVLERLLNAGFRLNKAKCKFFQSSVVYLGHVIDGEGLYPTLGLIMFYSRFMPHNSTVLVPLHQLLKKGTSWRWLKAEEDAFVAAKQLILNSQTLVHCDHTLPLFLSCDASSYGAGAVLCHQIDGQFRPVAFASCSFTPAPARKGGLQYHLWIKEIPTVSLWSMVAPLQF